MSQPKLNGKRVSGAASLTRLLQDLGLPAQEANSTTVATVVDAPGVSDGQLTASLTVRVDRGTINLAMPLAKVSENSVPSGKLLQLLNLTRNDNAIYVAYLPDTNWIGIRRTISNQNLTAESLQARLQEMVQFAENSADIWQPLGDSLKVVEKKANQNTQQPSRSASPAPAKPVQQVSLEGTWSAPGNNNAGFAIAFSGNKFTLAVSNGGNASTSTGTWSVANGQLKLAGSDMTLSGALTIKSSSEFELKLPNQNPLTFTKQ